MEVKEFYKIIHGDYEKALQIMMNDLIIAKFLKKFVTSQSLDAINEAYKNKNNETLFSLVHSLKGVAGNLCLDNLFESASKITEMTRNKTNDELINLDEEMDTLNKKFATTIDLINQL